MAKIYYKRIIVGLYNYNNVPSLWKKQVKEMLEANGYIINEDGTVTEAEDVETAA